MSYNFDTIIDRRSSNSIKWNKYPEDILPLWVADMDFPAPPPVLEALYKAVEHGVLGYEMPSTALMETVAAPRALSPTPGPTAASGLRVMV